jgi:anti-sigma-K factor RskA
LAGEFALGVLDGEDLARARSLHAADADFRSEVADWWVRLAPLLDEVEDREPPVRVWAALQRRIGGEQVGDSDARLRKRLNLWRGVAAGASALAASLALVLVTRPDPAPPPAVDRPTATPDPMVAMLGEEGEAPKLVAAWEPDNRRLVLAVAAEMPGDAAHSHELWVIPADGKPRSLGTMPAASRMHMDLDPATSQQLHAGATLAVSVEPRGGSPTGQPTGPVVASGKLERA